MRRKSHYIAVDKDEVMRCSWCGTAESERWVNKGDGRGTYCSHVCENAASYDSVLCRTIAIPTLWIVTLSTIEFFDPADISIFVMLLGTTFVIFICCPLSYSLIQLSDVRKARSEVARGSRRFDRVFDERYLKCMNCGAPLDIDGGKTYVDCSYCGTKNRISYS